MNVKIVLLSQTDRQTDKQNWFQVAIRYYGGGVITAKWTVGLIADVTYWIQS